MRAQSEAKFDENNMRGSHQRRVRDPHYSPLSFDSILVTVSEPGCNEDMKTASWKPEGCDLSADCVMNMFLVCCVTCFFGDVFVKSSATDARSGMQGTHKESAVPPPLCKVPLRRRVPSLHRRRVRAPPPLAPLSPVSILVTFLMKNR